VIHIEHHGPEIPRRTPTLAQQQPAQPARWLRPDHPDLPSRGLHRCRDAVRQPV